MIFPQKIQSEEKREILYIHSSLTEKIFREINSLVKPLVSRNFCQKSVRENFRNFHKCEIMKIFGALPLLLPLLSPSKWVFYCCKISKSNIILTSAVYSMFSLALAQFIWLITSHHCNSIIVKSYLKSEIKLFNPK